MVTTLAPLKGTSRPSSDGEAAQNCGRITPRNAERVREALDRLVAAEACIMAVAAFAETTMGKRLLKNAGQLRIEILMLKTELGCEYTDPTPEGI